MIPRVIHFVFLVFKGKGPNIPEKWANNLNEWRKTHPNFEIKLWDDKKSESLLKKHFPQYVSLYNKLTYDIQRADMIRYCILHMYGGVYCDLDIRPKHNIENLLKLYEVDTNFQVGLAQSPNVNTTSNFFMMSMPESKFWLNVLKTIKLNQSVFYLTRQTQVMKQSGPLMLNNMLPHNGVVVIPAQILSDCDWCSKNSCNTFGYIINEQDGSWNSSVDKVINNSFCFVKSHVILMYMLLCVFLIYIGVKLGDLRRKNNNLILINS